MSKAARVFVQPLLIGIKQMVYEIFYPPFQILYRGHSVLLTVLFFFFYFGIVSLHNIVLVPG